MNVKANVPVIFKPLPVPLHAVADLGNGQTLNFNLESLPGDAVHSLVNQLVNEIYKAAKKQQQAQALCKCQAQRQ